MERDELQLRERVQKILEEYTFEEILLAAGHELEDVLIFLIHEYSLDLPEQDPL